MYGEMPKLSVLSNLNCNFSLSSGISFIDVVKKNFSSNDFRSFMSCLNFLEEKNLSKLENCQRDFNFINSFFGLVNNERFSNLCFDYIVRNDWRGLGLLINEKYEDNVDNMTKFYQKKHFNRALDIYKSRCESNENFEFSLIYADLDNFKSINDRFGHSIGDLVLSKFADITRENLRSSDYGFRNGGEEFAFILPDLSLMGGVRVAERIRGSIEDRLNVVTDFDHFRVVDLGREPKNLEFALENNVTCSFGVSSYDGLRDFGSLVSAADSALYSSKNSGRNSVTYYK